MFDLDGSAVLLDELVAVARSLVLQAWVHTASLGSHQAVLCMSCKLVGCFQHGVGELQRRWQSSAGVACTSESAAAAGRELRRRALGSFDLVLDASFVVCDRYPDEHWAPGCVCEVACS